MIKKIKIPIYNGTLVLIQNKSLQDIPKKWKPEKFDLSGYAAVTCHRDNKFGFRYFVILFTKSIGSKTIAHEALHCMSDIFDHRGIKFDIYNDEPAAYLLGWIVDQCHKYLKVKK